MTVVARLGAAAVIGGVAGAAVLLSLPSGVSPTTSGLTMVLMAYALVLLAIPAAAVLLLARPPHFTWNQATLVAVVTALAPVAVVLALSMRHPLQQASWDVNPVATVVAATTSVLIAVIAGYVAGVVAYTGANYARRPSNRHATVRTPHT